MRSKKGKGATGEPPAKPRIKIPNEVTVFYGHGTDEIRSVGQPEEAPATNAAPSAPTRRESEIAELARVIVGEGRPIEDWLLAGIEKAAAGVAWAACKAEEHPAREKFRGQLEAAVMASTYLRVILTKRTFLNVLSASFDDNLYWDRELYRGLGSLIVQAERALAEFPKGSSRHKHDPGTNSAQEICALAICAAWRGARGELPRHTSRKAWEACRRLWTTAGLVPSNFSNGLEGWRPHLERAKADLANGDRPEVELMFRAPAR